MKLYDRKGQAREFAPEEAAKAYASGEWGLPKSAVVPMLGPDGDVYRVNGADVHQALAAGGGFAPPEVARHAELEEKYGGAGGYAGAAAAGAARGLTLGLSDVVAGAVGGESARERLNAYKELHPVLSVGSEVAGAVLPTLFSGGGAAAVEGANLARAGATAVREGATLAREASTLARAGEAGTSALKAAGALPRGVAAMGEGVERAVLAGLGGESKTVVGRVFQKAAAMGARGAVEGAAYGAGGTISEAALGDHELTAEKLFAGIGHGAFYGALSGGALGAGGEVASAGLAKAAGAMRPILTDLADTQAWRALSPLKKFTNEAERRAGGARAVGRTLRNEVDIAVGDTVETLAPKIAEAQERVGQKLADVVKQSGGSVRGGKLLGAIDDVIAPLEKKAGFEPIVESLKGYRNSVGQKLGLLDEAGALLPGAQDASVTLDSLLTQRKALDQLAFQESKALDPKLRVQFLRDIRSAMEKAEVEAIDQAAKGVTAAEYKALKKTYQHLALASDAANDTVSRMVTNNSLSLGDKIAGAAGLVAGGPVGMVKGAALAYGSKLVREKGNATMAVVLGRLSELGTIQKVASRVDASVDAGVAGFFSGKPKALGPRRARIHHLEGADSYEEKAREVAEAKDHPYRAAALVAPMTKHAPMTAGALGETATRATTYLASVFGGQHNEPSLQPQYTPPRLTDAERIGRMRKAETVEDPMSAVEDLQNGRITREQVEALKTVYPKLYQEIRTKVMERVVEADRPLPYTKRVQLGILFDAPTDRSLLPQNIKSAQAVYAARSNAPGEKATQGAPPARPLKGTSSASAQTTSQKVEGR